MATPKKPAAAKKTTPRAAKKATPVDNGDAVEVDIPEVVEAAAPVDQKAEHDAQVRQAAEAIVNQLAIRAGELPMVEPDEDELDETLELVSNGWVRCSIAGVPYKLRRPFIGELEDLEKSLEADATVLTDLQDQLREEQQTDLARAKEIQAEAAEVDNDSIEKAELDEEATMLGLKVMRRQQRLSHESDKLRVAWWTEVFTRLTPPGGSQPPDFPTWVADPQLPHQIVAHWRRVPLGRGNR